MLHPTISNEKYDKANWFTQITVPQSWDNVSTGMGRTRVVNTESLVPPGYGMTFSGGRPKYISFPTVKVGLLKIPDSHYTPLHPQSISLEDCEGDRDGSTFEFAACVTLPFDGQFKKYKFEESALIPLYHAHVLSSYVVRLTRVEDDKYKLSYASKGAHLGGRNQVNQKNVPRDLVAPPITSSYLAIRSKDGNLTCGPFTKDELLWSAVDGKLTVYVRLSVPRDYFSLEKIIDLKKKPIVSEANRKVVETILRHERPAGANYVLTDGSFRMEDSPYRYHVHMQKFAEDKENIGVMSEEYIRSAEEEEAVCITGIRIAYGVEVPLPDKVNNGQFNSLAEMQGTKEVAVPQWEREICRRALALNPHDPTPASLVELLFLLSAIWEAPIGWFPVAKRVAIGVLADVVHLNARSSVFDFVQNMILPHIPESGLATVHLPSVLGSMMKHLNAVSRVRKTTVDLSSGDSGHLPDLAPTVPGIPLLGDDDEAEDEESSSESSSEDQRSSGDEENEDTVDEKDTVDVAAREDWYNGESGGVENPDENEWTCTIS